MATISANDQAILRQEVAKVVLVRWTKPQANAINQAVEDAFEAAKPSIVSAMQAAASGSGLTPALTNAEMKQFVRHWLALKFRLEA